ncbi:hypothetical protein [Mucilaginibacter phyllosphaerae]|uniref:Uncharacterized protein n=1 Tax=Mucilaginibacter phyllosphaerae TaxID=1812349 RepID=A0A4Y8AIM6_9SPHI|nr:hypothetical protein [Mucilaginibacter phyllosphaerae]MBB3968051.1 hypothetical protein [Mucilaginibacter phyllosphaerae]TEW68926.1 hypothetical protein E2R65_01820 [Mucilaginibacter phyllosphaerae]GGH01546.1 hypothetical protein GCM10007352_03380 [Mucilaginibacter phyllosphaerae]
MKIPVTPDLLKFVISKGFRYCYSKTTCIDAPDADVCITLTPVKMPPRIKRLPKAYDTFFNIFKEPFQMANGVDRTRIFFDLKNL